MQGTDHFLRWRFIPVARFDEIAPHWQRLALKRTMAPFLQLEFIEPLLRQFSDGREQIAIAERYGEVSALAILSPPARGRQEQLSAFAAPLRPDCPRRAPGRRNGSRDLDPAASGVCIGGRLYTTRRSHVSAPRGDRDSDGWRLHPDGLGRRRRDFCRVLGGAWQESKAEHPKAAPQAT